MLLLEKELLEVVTNMTMSNIFFVTRVSLTVNTKAEEWKNNAFITSEE